MHGPFVILVVFGGVFAATALVILAFAKPKSRTQVEGRLKRAAGGGRKLSAREPRAKTAPLRVLEERLKPFAVERLTEEKEGALLKQLRMSGNYDATPTQF